MGTVNIISVAGTVGMRFAIGPVAESYGPRVAQTAMLLVFALPLALSLDYPAVSRAILSGF